MLAWKAINKRKLFFNFLVISISSIASYIMPVVLEKNLTEPFLAQNLLNIIICIIILRIITTVFEYIWQVYGMLNQETIYKDIELAYFKKLVTLKESTLNNSHSGFIKNTIHKIADSSYDFISYLCYYSAGFVFGISLFLIQIFKQSRILFIVCIIFIVLLILFNFLLNKKHINYQKDLNDKMSDFNTAIVDSLENIKIVKLFNCMSFMSNKIENFYSKTIDSQKKAYRSRTIKNNIVNVGTNILLVIVLLDLYFQAQNGTPVFSYVVFYITIFEKISGELRGLTYLFLSFANLKASLKIWDDFVGKDNKSLDFNNKWNSLSIKVKDFCYEDSLTCINIPKFEINKGDKISIIGESGQGKTTFLNLLMKQYDFDGKYIIDNNISKEIPDIAIVSQNSDLFNFSIRENLTLGKNICDDILFEYIADAGLSEWLQHLPKGLDTVVGEKGVKLSAGQKQRLNIIRSLILNKDFYIFDEPTSNLDEESEQKIYDMINKYLNKKTYIIITHRKKLVSLCSKHYYFENHFLKKTS